MGNLCDCIKMKTSYEYERRRARPLVQPSPPRRPSPRGQRYPPRDSYSPTPRDTVVVRVEAEHVGDVSGAPLGKKWYHGQISDEQAANRLIYAPGTPENGTYLVYDDPKHRGWYMLMVWMDREVHKWHIRMRRDGKYILGDDCPGAIAHESVRKLVKYHRGLRGKPIKLEDGRMVTLTKSYVYVVD